MDAVEVGDKCINVQAKGRGGSRQAPLRQFQVGHGVDVDSVFLRNPRQRERAEESMPGIEEARGVHDVEGAGFPEARLAVLAARAPCHVVADGVCGSGFIAGPMEPVVGNHREAHVRCAAGHRGDGCLQVGGVDHRGGALDEDGDLGEYVQRAQGV